MKSRNLLKKGHKIIVYIQINFIIKLLFYNLFNNYNNTLDQNLTKHYTAL